MRAEIISDFVDHGEIFVKYFLGKPSKFGEILLSLQCKDRGGEGVHDPDAVKIEKVKNFTM